MRNCTCNFGGSVNLLQNCTVVRTEKLSIRNLPETSRMTLSEDLDVWMGCSKTQNRAKLVIFAPVREQRMLFDEAEAIDA